MANKKNQVIFDILANTVKYEKGMEKTVNVTEVATKAMKIGFVALSAAAVGAVVAFGKFQKGLGDISTIIDTSTESVKDIGEEILKLARTTPKPISELVASMYDIRSAGISASNAMETLNSAGKLATVGLATTKEATDILTTSINTFKSEGLSATEISNILFKTVKYGKNTISQLAQSFGQTAPLVKSAGVSLVEFSAATAALTALGIPASVAQNQLRAAMVSLQKQTAQMKTVFKALGKKDMPDLMKSSDSLGDAFRKIYDKAKELDIPLTKVTGRVEGANAITVIATSGAEVYTKALKDMAGGADSVTEALEKQNATLDAQRQILMNLMNETFINLGSTMEKSLVGIGKFVSDIFKDLTDLIKANAEGMESVFTELSSIVVSTFQIFQDLIVILADLFKIFGGYQAALALGIALKVVVVALELLVGIVKTAVSMLAGFLDILGPLGTALKVVAGVMLAMKAAAFLSFIWGVVTATKAWAIATSALNAIMALNPVILIAMAVIAVGLAIADVVVNINEWKLAWSKFANNFLIGFQKIKALMSSGDIKKAAEERILALEKENNTIDKQVEALKARKAELKSQGKSSFQADRQAGNELAEAKKLSQAKKDLLAKNLNEEESMKAASAARLRDQQMSEFNTEMQFSADNYELLTEAELAQLQSHNEIIAEEKEYARIAELEAQGKHDEAMAALRKANEDKLIKQSKAQIKLEKQTQQAKLSIVANSIALVNALVGKETKATFLASKALAAAQIIISGLTAEAAALAPPPLGLGPVGGAGLAGLIRANTAIQLATVAATTIQGFAVGTDYVPEDMTANIHQGEGIIPARENQFLQSGKLSLVSSDLLVNNMNNNNSSGRDEEPAEVEVALTMNENFMDMIEAEIIQRRANGISKI